MFRADYLQALSEVVFSRILQPRDTKALGAARNVISAIEQMEPELQKVVARWDERVIAPALENCSQAFLMASEGDAEMALGLARRALAIREKSGDSGLLMLRIVAFSLHGLGRTVEARQAAERYVQEFARVNKVKVNSGEGILVVGRFVTLLEIMSGGTP